MRQRILGEYQKGVRNLNISEIAEEIFTGDWGEVKSSHPLLWDVPSGEQIVIVPAVRGDPRIKQLVAVAFVAGSSGGELIGEEIDVEVWLEGELDRSFTDTTNDQGFIQLATADELLEYGGCTLRFRVETDFGSDEVTFTPDPDELCATGGRFGVNGLHHFYKQNH